MNTKPFAQLSGRDGNIFAVMGRANRALKDAGERDAATEMIKRVTSSGSYDEALSIIWEYVEDGDGS